MDFRNTVVLYKVTVIIILYFAESFKEYLKHLMMDISGRAVCIVLIMCFASIQGKIISKGNEF